MDDALSSKRVLVVGATGHLGGKVVEELIRRQMPIRALVRPGSDAARLESLGVEIARGDLLDRDSLSRAVVGVDAIITTAAGYMRRRRTDTDEIDLKGNFNLADATRAAGTRVLVFTSVLNCEQAREVPHFWNKKLVEDYLVKIDVPFVSLRPGAFIDQGRDYLREGVEKGIVPAIGDPRLAYTQVLCEDVARFLVAAVHTPAALGQRISIGCDRPASAIDVAAVISARLGRRIRVRAIPWWLASAGLALAGVFSAGARDFRAMLKFAQTGNYVADTSAQRLLFGELPTVEDALERWLQPRGPDTKTPLAPLPSGGRS